MKLTLQSSSVRALLVASLGFGGTACMADNVNSQSQWGDYGPSTSSRYASFYDPAKTHEKPYILQAESNGVPQLRGMRSAPQPVYQNQYYRDYEAPAQTYEPQQVKPQQIAKQKPQNTITQAYNYGFSHQLDDASPIMSTLYEPAASYSSKVFDFTVFDPMVSQTIVSQDINYAAQISQSVTVTPAMSINQSLSRARSQSPRLEIEDIKIREAEESLVQAKAQGRFKLNLDSVIGASQNETVFRVVNRTDSDLRVRRAANLDLSLPLYQGGRINAQKNIAKVDIKTAKANYEAVQSAVTQEAAIAHLNVMRDRLLIQIYKRNVTLLGSQKQTVHAMVQAGENTITDEALLDARLASIQVRLEQAKSNLAFSESNYKKLTGRMASSLMPTGSVGLPTSLEAIKDAAQKNNAQVKAVQTLAEAAYHNVALAKSFGRPKLSLQGVLRAAEGQSETIRSNSAAEVLLNLSVPILSGGENRSRVRQAALAQSRAVLEARELQYNLDEQLEQLWARVQSARRSKAPNQAQKIAAQKAYEAIVKQRNAGVATSLDVLSVEQTLLDAEINLVQAQNTEDVSRFQLLGLMGEL